MPSKVNIDRLPRQEVRNLFIERIKGILAEAFPNVWVDISALGFIDSGIDFIACMQMPSGPQLELRVEVKVQPRPSQVPGLPSGDEIPAVSIAKAFNPDPTVRRVVAWVFAAPFVSPRLAEVCWNKGWGWFDLAGNCRIVVPGLLYLDRKGNEPVHITSRPDANLGTPEASRVLRRLLESTPGLRWWKSQRELQQAIEPAVSLGLVNKIVTHLRSEGLLAADERGGLRVVDPEKLLFAWRDAYRFDRIPQLGWFTLLKTAEIERVIREVNLDNPPKLAWAAFSAAERQAPMVRQPKYWLMSADVDVAVLRDHLQAKSVDTGANLTLLMAPDQSFLTEADRESAMAACTSPLQTYLDTWHAGGRGQEAAEAILEQQLRPRWKRRDNA